MIVLIATRLPFDLPLIQELGRVMLLTVARHVTCCYRPFGMEQQGQKIADAIAHEAEAILSQADPVLAGKVRDLFVYLLETTLAGAAIKEFDIANQVFGRGADFDAAQDAAVRVCVHRLRRRLEEHYLRHPDVAQRLAIPKGQYRLILIDIREQEAEAGSRVSSARFGVGFWRGAALVMACLALAATSVGVSLYWGKDASANRRLRSIAETKLWNGIYGARGFPSIVVGDYYFIGETDGAGKVTGLTRRFDVNSPVELEELIASSHTQSKYVDVGLGYVPVGTAGAIRQVLPILGAASPTDRYAPIVPISNLTPEMVKSSNLVYVGLLNGIGRLRHAALGNSRLQVSANYDELFDRKTQKHYVIGGSSGNLEAAHREFAYLARIRGPSGNTIIVIAGSGDAGLVEAAAIAQDENSLRSIEKAVGTGREFEALFQVAATGLVTYGTQPVFISPVNAQGAWKD